MKSLCIVGHPDISSSASQQFLIQSGKANTYTTYLDVAKDPKAMEWSYIQELVRAHDQLIFQFPLYWYQMPAVLKHWIDEWLSLTDTRELANKTMGLVVIVGGKRISYQAGGKVGRTLSELLSNFQVLAQILKMNYRSIFAIHQFNYLSEAEKMALMWRYSFYLESLSTRSHDYRYYILEKAKNLGGIPLGMTTEEEILWQTFLNNIEQLAEQVDDLMTILHPEES